MLYESLLAGQPKKVVTKWSQTKGQPIFRSANLFFLLVGDAGFEPTAFGSGELNKMHLIQQVRFSDVAD